MANELTDPAKVSPLDQRLMAVYLIGLNTVTSSRTIRQSLDMIAHLISGGQKDATELPWAELLSCR